MSSWRWSHPGRTRRRRSRQSAIVWSAKRAISTVVRSFSRRAPSDSPWWTPEVGDRILRNREHLRRRSYVSPDQVDEALGAYERAENLSRLDGPDADQAAHVRHATLADVECRVKEPLRQRRTHRETPRLSELETRVGRELKALKERVEAIPDRGWVRRRWGVRGRLPLDADPAELTLRW